MQYNYKSLKWLIVNPYGYFFVFVEVAFMQWFCSCCGSKAKTTHSTQVTRELRQGYATCTNVECQAREQLSLASDRIINPPINQTAAFNLVTLVRNLPAEEKKAFIASIND